jgi:hypothetical protein
MKNHSNSVGAASLAKEPEDFAPDGACGSDAATLLPRGCSESAERLGFKLTHYQDLA